MAKWIRGLPVVSELQRIWPEKWGEILFSEVSGPCMAKKTTDTEREIIRKNNRSKTPFSETSKEIKNK